MSQFAKCILLGAILAAGSGVAAAQPAQSPGFSATVATMKRIARGSPRVRTITFGQSGEGRSLTAAVVAANAASADPGSARSGHKAVVFVVSGLHVGDLAGKDAVLAWLGQVAAAAKAPAWMDHVVVVAVPALNADGMARFAANGEIPVQSALSAPFQGTPALVDLSRDFLYAHSPAMHAWLSLVATWHPDAYLALRTNLRQPPSRYRLTWSGLPASGLAGPVARWEHGELSGLSDALSHQGLANDRCYRARDAADPETGLEDCLPQPGSLAQLAMLTNRPETELVLPREQTYDNAVAAGAGGLGAAVAGIGDQASGLLDAVAAADRNPAGDGGKAVLDFHFSGDKTPRRRFRSYAYTTMLSPISGGVWARFATGKDKTYFLPWARDPKASETADVWNGYAVPAAWGHVIDLLALHGVVMHRLPKSSPTAVRTYFITGREGGAKAPHDRPRGLTVAPRAGTVSLPAGSAVIAGQQPAAKLIAALLDPDSSVSIARGGFLDRVFRASVPLPDASLEARARTELAKHPGLARKFARRLAQDPAFAASPARRLAYFVQHGSGAEPLLDVYPVYEVPQPGGH